MKQWTGLPSDNSQCIDLLSHLRGQPLTFSGNPMVNDTAVTPKTTSFRIEHFLQWAAGLAEVWSRPFT